MSDSLTPKRLDAIRERAKNGCGVDAPDVRDLLAEVERLQAGIDDAADELVREMKANVPLSPPDREYDPNDEFKRCAVDRMERVKRWRERRVVPLLNPTEGETDE